ncbi:MAG: DUF6443 domain-containing protein [Bacteroidota bacterium]
MTGLAGELYQYLPFKADTTGGNTYTRDGFFKYNPFQQQAVFMQQQYSSQGETYFYGQTVFEESPLNRPNKTMAPGNSWVGASRGVEVKYRFNTVTDSVRIWIVTNAASGFGSYATSANYAAGELFKMVTADEHGKQVVEFKDKEGLVVLKKVQLSADPDTGTGKGYAGWLNTYYIYDSVSRLRCVVQPQGVELLRTNSWSMSYSGGVILDEQCFRYEYDASNRMILKKVPGAGIVYMIYDARDRVVKTQDSLLRAAHKWMYTLYDGLNRPIISGLITDNTYYNNAAYHRGQAISSISYPNTGSYTDEVLTKTFYDNYDWRSAESNPLKQYKKQ